MKRATLTALFVAATVLGAASTHAQSLPTSLTNGLVAFYPFDGNANDESGNGHHGTVVGSQVTLTNGVNGAANSAYRFAPLPDENHIVATGPNLSGSSLSVSLWFKKDYTTFGVEHGWLFRLGSESDAGKVLSIAADYGQAVRFAFFFNELDIQSPRVGENEWSHIACTYDQSTMVRQIFVDGQMIANDVAQFGFSGDTFLRLNGGGGDKVGLLDQVRFYNRVLTADEIGQLYRYERIGPPSLTRGLVAYYPFDGNANDESGNGNNGTPSGNYQFLPSGRHGGAIRIIGDGSLFYSGGGHVLLPTFDNALNNGFTFSFWAKDEVIGGSPVNGEAYIAFGALNNKRAEVWLNSVIPGPVFAIDNGSNLSREIGVPLNFSSFIARWKQIVMAYQPGNLSCYIDGTKVIDTNITINPFPVGRAALGRHWWDGGASSSARMSATLDDVRIYSRGLSEEEVSQLYQYELRSLPRLSVAVKTIELRTEVEVGKTYQLQASPNLTTWTNWGSAFTATVPAYTNDVDVTAGHLYFRAQEVVNP